MNAFGYFIYPDGYTDPNKIRLTLSSPTNDGFPVNPSAFHDIVGNETITIDDKVVDGFTYTVHNANSGTSVTGRSGLSRPRNSRARA